jgi:hypothetical protein
LHHEAGAATMSRTGAAVTVLVLVGLLAAAAGGEEPPVVAKITVSSSPATSTLSTGLVEGRMTFRGRTYLLTLRGTAGAASAVGSVSNLVRANDIEGVYRPADGELRNDGGVRLRFDPPLPLQGDQLQIEIASRIYPKVSTGQGNSVE